jgi:hypothetical protein
MRTAAPAYDKWLRAEFVPFAKRLGFSGRGPGFRKRSNGNWLVFDLERRRIDPREVALIHDDPRIEFRVNVGVVSPTTRPSWMPERKSARPSTREAVGRGWDEALDPHAHDGSFWFVFDARDPTANARLAARLRPGIERAVAELEARGTSDRALLDFMLRSSGPLENLAPGHAEILLALADSVGDAAVRQRIVEALQRPSVPEPDLAARGLRRPGSGGLWPRLGPRRLAERALERLLTDARSDRVQARRQALALLGDVEAPPPEVALTLRLALMTDDKTSRSIAAVSLAHQRDAAPATWHQVLELARDPQSEPLFVGTAIVLLERIDPNGRRAAAESALDGLANLKPAWLRDVAVWKTKLA